MVHLKPACWRYIQWCHSGSYSWSPGPGRNSPSGRSCCWCRRCWSWCSCPWCRIRWSRSTEHWCESSVSTKKLNFWGCPSKTVSLLPGSQFQHSRWRGRPRTSCPPYCLHAARWCTGCRTPSARSGWTQQLRQQCSQLRRPECWG